MTKLFKSLVVAIALTLPSVAVAEDMTEAQIKALALQAIRENPEIIAEAITILQQKQENAESAQAQAVMMEKREILQRDPNAPVMGNPDGDVVIVEFFDYNCPYCKRAAEDVKTLIDIDDQVRVVYREWPILGEGSVFASRAALASREQGKYEEFHWAMMTMKGRAEEASVLRVAKDVGLDIEKLKTDMQAPEIDAHIQLSMDLAQSLGFNGTPSFTIGDQLVPGLVALDQMQDVIEAERAKIDG